MILHCCPFLCPIFNWNSFAEAFQGMYPSGILWEIPGQSSRRWESSAPRMALKIDCSFYVVPTIHFSPSALPVTGFSSESNYFWQQPGMQLKLIVLRHRDYSSNRFPLKGSGECQALVLEIWHVPLPTPTLESNNWDLQTKMTQGSD